MNLAQNRQLLLGLVLLHPQLSRNLPESLFIGKRSPEIEALREIKGLVKNSAVNTNGILGHFYGWTSRPMIEKAFIEVGAMVDDGSIVDADTKVESIVAELLAR